MKRWIQRGLIFFIILSVTAVAQATVYSDNDLLIEKMVDKGYLTPMEAQMLQEETREYVDQHMARGRMMTLPEWVQLIKLQGDVRLRYQYEKRQGSVASRSTEKLRVRLGLISQINEKATAAVGIATGGGNPRSSNVTFDEAFTKGDIRLDYAYGEFRPADWFHIIGGQFPKDHYLWTPTNHLWDSDINPTGVSVHLEKTLFYKYGLFLNAGRWALYELVNDSRDLALYYGQAGVSYEGEYFDAKVAGQVYYFDNLKGYGFQYSSCSNTGLSGDPFQGCIGTMKYDFRPRGGSAEVGFRMPINEQYKRIAVFGDVIQNNFGPEDKDTAWAYGFKLGDIAVKSPWHWQLLYQYTHLEQDAFPDVFTNSSRYDGQTGVEGHTAKLKFGLAENVYFGLNYYRDKKINSSSENPQRLYQADLTFKF
ncbi:MAG: putative porin [Candidatus Omnitrophota bacterium]